MNFSITISGEGPELAKALNNLKTIMDEHQITDGSVTATVAPAPSYPFPPQGQPPAYQMQPAPAVPQAPPAVPTYQAPTAPAQGYNPPAQPNSFAPPPPAGAVPTGSAPAYTMEQLAVAATPLMDAGRQAEVVQLLQQFGAQALTQLPKERYGDFATALRSLGAKI